MTFPKQVLATEAWLLGAMLA